MLDGGTRTAEATAIEPCELLVMERRDFLPLVRSHPELAIRLIEILCARVRRTSEQVEDIMFRTCRTGLPRRCCCLICARAPKLLSSRSELRNAN